MFTILTDHKPLDIFMNRTQLRQKLRRLQEFLGSFNQTIVHTAGKQNNIADTLYRNSKRTSTFTEEDDYISQRIDNTTLHRAATLPTSHNPVTWNHFSFHSLILEMSEYQSASSSNFSYADRVYNLCRSHATAAGNHHSCATQDEYYWYQFIGYSEDSDFQHTKPAT